jgi:hypothetical protein
MTESQNRPRGIGQRQLTSRSFRDGGTIPGEFSFAVINPAGHISLSSNHDPHLEWSDVLDG